MNKNFDVKYDVLESTSIKIIMKFCIIHLNTNGFSILPTNKIAKISQTSNLFQKSILFQLKINNNG